MPLYIASFDLMNAFNLAVEASETWRLKARAIVKAATTLAGRTSCMCTNLEQPVGKKVGSVKHSAKTQKTNARQMR